MPGLPGFAQFDPAGYSTVATNTTALLATTTNTLIKATPGRLITIQITAGGSTTMQFVDSNQTTNTNGTLLGVALGTAAVGTTYTLNQPAVNGILAVGNAGNPGVTVGWS